MKKKRMRMRDKETIAGLRKKNVKECKMKNNIRNREKCKKIRIE